MKQVYVCKFLMNVSVEYVLKYRTKRGDIIFVKVQQCFSNVFIKMTYV